MYVCGEGIHSSHTMLAFVNVLHYMTILMAVFIGTVCMWRGEGRDGLYRRPVYVSMLRAHLYLSVV